MPPEPKPPPEPAPRTNPGYQYSAPKKIRMQRYHWNGDHKCEGTYGPEQVVVELDGGAVAYYGKFGR